MTDSATVSTSKLEDSAALEIFGIIIIIILLFIQVLLVIIFRLYTVRHHFWNHQTTRQPTSSDLPTLRTRQPTSSDLPTLHTRQPTSSDLPTLQQRRGLDPSILKSIKVVRFSAAEDQLGLKCSVCLCQVSEGEKARYLPRCNHGFHMQCIDIWFHSHSTCPLCRNIVTISADELEAAAVDTGVSPNSQPPNVSSSTPSSSAVINDGHLAIDITIVRTEAEDQKSPATVTPTAALYRSLSRLLSRNS